MRDYFSVGVSGGSSADRESREVLTAEMRIEGSNPSPHIPFSKDEVTDDG